MKTFCFAVCALVALCPVPEIARAETTILAENFNSTWSTVNPPPGWSILFAGDTSTNDWHRAPDLGFNPWPDNPTPYAALGPGELDIDMLITPVLDFTGCENVVLRCSLGFQPGTGYHDAKIVASTDSGITFNRTIDSLTGRSISPGLFTYNLPWAADQRRVRIAFQLAGEETGIDHFVVDNVSITASLRATDVGVLRILAPSDTVDSGAIVPPRCRVFNPSPGVGSFWTRVTIGNYRDSAWVSNLAPGDSANVTFTAWHADTFGFIPVRFQTLLPRDLNPENDTASRLVFVKPPYYNDVASLAILAPAGSVVETTLVIPRGVIGNFGPNPVTLKAYFDILFFGSPVYSDSVTAHLALNQIDTVSFTSWLATPPGTYNALLRVRAERDINPENDIQSSAFVVRAPSHDVGVAEILAPLDTVPPGPVIPRVKIVNYGTFTETNFRVHCAVFHAGTRVYYDSALVPSVGAGETALVSFSTWNASRGSYALACSTALRADQEPSNDRLEKTFCVRTPIQVGWQELARLPLGAKQVKNGGALTLIGNWVFALRGNKTDEFLRYDIETDSWEYRAPVPPGSNGKPVYKGGALTSDGTRYIYALKGNSQPDFFRYDTQTDSWLALKPVPAGPSGKPIKGGSSMAYVPHPGSGYVYLLKGYRNEFWRYNTGADSWEELPAAPLGPSGKNTYKEGSFIACDAAHTIYAVKAKYGEVFGFDLDSLKWLSTTFQRFPLAGRSGRQKKVKDGAGGVWWRNAMYCLKGGNTCEFWRFFPAENRWEELDTIPAYGSTGKKKRVKAGGAITTLGNGLFFALKGNKTDEFWCYLSPEAGPGIAEPRWIPAPESPQLSLTLYPNPTPGRIYGSVRLLPGENLMLTLYDPAGRRCYSTTLTDGRTHFSLNCTHLAPGIYFLSARTAQRSAFAKIVINSGAGN